MLLKKEYAYKFYLNSIFQKMKQETHLSLRVKYRVLFKTFKAWKDRLAYKKFMRNTNVQAIEFVTLNRSYTIRVVFNALRQHKESKKYNILV